MVKVIQRPGPIAIILVCFVISGTLRVGSQGMAIANEVDVTHETPAPAPHIEPAPEVGSLLASIQERQKQLEQREVEVSERFILLAEIEKRVLEQISVLEDAERKLARTLAIADGATETDLSRLTIVYEKMKPTVAAKIFETMEMSFAAGFLSRMKPEAAAGIMSEMPAEFAYSVSVVMAGRNANAPTE